MRCVCYRRMRGFTLIEMAITMSVFALIAIGLGMTNKYEAQKARGTRVGTAIAPYSQALQTYVTTYRSQLSTAVAIAGVAAPLAPTIAELRALNILPATYSLTMPTNGGTPTFQIARISTGCIGDPCDLSYLVYNAAPELDGDGTASEGTLALASNVIGGTAGYSRSISPSTIQGQGGWSLANPAGAVAGIFGVFQTYSSSGIASYVRVGDTRDPALAGNMTVSGTTSVAQLGVTGTATVGAAVVLKDPGAGIVCVQILVAGQIDVNCSGILNAKAGTFTGPLGVAKIGDTGSAYTIDTANRIRGSLGFYSAVGSVFGDNTLGVRATGGVFTVQTTNAGVDALAVQDQGRVGARNYLATPALGLSNPVAAFSPCATPDAEAPATLVTSAATTVVRALTGGGLASCSNGKWLPVGQIVTPGAACAPDGVGAVSAADGRALTCKNGVWMLLNDLLSSFVMVNTLTVTDGQVVAKPVCGQMGLGVGQPLGILIGQVESSKDASFDRHLNDLGPTWRVSLRNSDGSSLAGIPSAQGLLTVYCYY
jgi:prepilin-type N-terminal cleavage/methylation domain-containing protein